MVMSRVVLRSFKFKLLELRGGNIVWRSVADELMGVVLGVALLLGVVLLIGVGDLMGVVPVSGDEITFRSCAG